ncbi:endonuclease [Flavobacterium cyanobacteriorum]|nr:endonuclease [Flavobacterium cyanobacteriorum]
MKKTFTLAIALLSAFAYAQDGAPAAPYYNGFNFNQAGTALRNALAAKITDTHVNQLTYQQAENAIMIVDRDPADGTNTNLLLIYGFSSSLCPASTADDAEHRRRNKNFDDDGSNNPCLWNREHTYPRALGIPDLGTSGPGADVHHLRACDKKRNANRDNDKFTDGSGNSGPVGSAWYPGDEWKGDIARMMMYMYLRYGNQCLPKNVAVGSVVASDPNMPAILLQWNADDPVSQYEDNRNTYLGNLANSFAQGNRNPFIDNPYLATLIWGGPAAQNRWPALSTPELLVEQTMVYPNPAVNNEITIQTEAEIEAIELISINGQLVQKVSKPVFSNNIYVLQNLPQGFYMIRVESPQGSVTKKVIVN